MSEKKHLPVLIHADKPVSDDRARTLLPEVLPNPKSHLREGSVRERTLLQLDRLRKSGANPKDPQP